MRTIVTIPGVLAMLATFSVAQHRWLGDRLGARLGARLGDRLGAPESERVEGVRARVVASATRLASLRRRLARYEGRVDFVDLAATALAPRLRLVLTSRGLEGIDERVAVFDGAGNLIGVDGVDVAAECLVPDVVDGRLDAALARELRAFEVTLVDGRGAAEARGRAAAFAQRDPRQLEPWLVLTHTETGIDREAFDRAVDALADRPAYAARLVDAASARDPNALLVPAVERWVNRLARTRSPGREACRVAFEHCAAKSYAGGSVGFAFHWIESCRDDASALVRIVERLGAPDVRKACVEPRLTATGLGMRVAPSRQVFAETRFEIMAFDLGDWVGAARLGRRLVAARRGDATALNTFAWRLLTDEPFAGHLDELAREAARTMAEAPGWRTYWRLDTLALAEFRNGDVAAAVRLQREAIERCDAGCRARYARKLAAYERELAARAAKSK